MLAATVLAVAGIAFATAPAARDASDAGHWVGTWSASPQAAFNPVELKHQSVRQIVHVSIGGTRVRVRLSNAYGADSLQIGEARVGVRSSGSVDRPGLGPGADLRRVRSPRRSRPARWSSATR